MSRHYALPILMGSAVLAGCALFAPPFDQAPSILPSEAIVSQRSAAAQIDCISGTEAAQPIIRILPKIPLNALRSGLVSFIFDLDDAGTPINIRVTHTTEELFVKNATRAIEKWKYVPKTDGETADKRQNICLMIRTKLIDKQGRVLPTWTDVEAKNETYERYKRTLKK